MPESITYNTDCMEYMRTLPDNHFDLAVVDPPYGAGFTENGGCKGWFAKYHQDSSQTLNVERERESKAHRSITASEVPALDLKSTSVSRTGGTGAEKYGKKS